MSEDTSPQPASQTNEVLQSSSTNTPPRVLSQGMTQAQRKIMWKLLIELFLDHPQTLEPSSDEKVSSKR